MAQAQEPAIEQFRPIYLPTVTYPQMYGGLRGEVVSQRTLERILVTCRLLRTLKAPDMVSTDQFQVGLAFLDLCI